MWEQLVFLAIGAALPFLGQLAMKLRDNHEWLKREQLEAHSEFLAAVNVAKRFGHVQSAASRSHLVELLARIELISDRSTFEAASQLLDVVLSLKSPQRTQVSTELLERTETYLSRVHREIQIKSKKNPVTMGTAVGTAKVRKQPR